MLVVVVVVAHLWWIHTRATVEPRPVAEPIRATPSRGVSPQRSLGWVCALDLGTHASKAAVWTPGSAPRIIRFGSGHTLPSAVGLDADGGWLTGVEALIYAERYPSAVLRNPKAEAFRPEVVLAGPDRPWRVATTDLLAATYAELYRAAVADCPPGPLREIVLTHPAGWTNRAVGVLIEALERARIPDVLTTRVAEPVAAATWFGQHHPDVTGSGEPFVVVDVGGGSLDVAVLRSGPGRPEVLCDPGGRNDVGGTALDAALLAGAGELWGRCHAERWHELRVGRGPEFDAARRQCHENARVTKENLTELLSTGLRLTSPRWFADVEVTRGLFDAWVEELVWVIVRTVESMCVTAEVRSGGPVFLSGGSSRVPLLRSTLIGRGFAVVDPDGGAGAAELTVVSGAVLHGQELRHG